MGRKKIGAPANTLLPPSEKKRKKKKKQGSPSPQLMLCPSTRKNKGMLAFPLRT